MSKLFEPISGYVSIVLCFGIIFVGNHFLDRLWNWYWVEKKTETWINIEKGRGGSFTKDLDSEWAAFTLKGVSIKGKIRNSMWIGEDRYAFVFKVAAKLTPPKLKINLENKVVKRYQFDFTFYFIDEDGFIIHEFTPDEAFSLKHETYEKYIDWTPEKYSDKEVNVNSEAIAEREIPKGVAERIRKIVYVPKLRAEIENKEKIVHKEKIEGKKKEEFSWDKLKSIDSLYDEELEEEFEGWSQDESEKYEMLE